MVQGVAITDENIVKEIRDMLSRNEHFLGVFMRKESAMDGESRGCNTSKSYL